jgi:hypothetical protein
MRRNLIVLLASLFALANIGLISTNAVENTIDYSQPGRYGFGICKTEIQLDCLEPIISVSHKDGTSSTAEYLTSGSNEAVVAFPAYGGSLAHSFRVRSGTSTGEYKYFNVRTEIGTPAKEPGGHMWISVNGGTKLKANECDESLKKLCTRYTLDPEDKFTFVVRSQRVPEENLRAIALNGEITRDDYLSGERWILKGSQILQGWSPGLSWWIASTIPDAASKAKVIRCAGNGVVFTSSNALTAREPSWDRRKNSLNFGIQSPHLDANGDLNTGFFNARIPKKWLDCTYPENTLSMASEVVVSITYDDGSTQVATSSTRVTDELIYVDVPLLHFSSPTIRVTNAALVKAAPSPKSLSCIKGKAKKKVTASKCPSGWKLVV